MYLPAAAGDRVLGILDCAQTDRRQLQVAARQRGISVNQLLAAAIVGSIQRIKGTQLDLDCTVQRRTASNVFMIQEARTEEITTMGADRERPSGSNPIGTVATFMYDGGGKLLSRESASFEKGERGQFTQVAVPY
jgi:hypothetical protein